MPKIELEAMIDTLPGPGEEPISMREWSSRLSEGSLYPKTQVQQLRDRYHLYRNAGLLEGWVTVEERIENGRSRYFFSRAVPQSYNPDEQVVELTTRPVLKPHPPRAPLVPSLIHVGDRFRGIRPS